MLTPTLEDSGGTSYRPPLYLRPRPCVSPPGTNQLRTRARTRARDGGKRRSQRVTAGSGGIAGQAPHGGSRRLRGRERRPKWWLRVFSLFLFLSLFYPSIYIWRLRVCVSLFNPSVSSYTYAYTYIHIYTYIYILG